MARARTKVNYGVIHGYTARIDGIVRKDSVRITREIVRVARVNVRMNSRKRWTGFKRTGNLAASIRDSHRWANQYGCGREVKAGVPYSVFVHRGTRPSISRPGVTRGSGGRFESQEPGGWMPVGRSQDAVTTLKRSVRGQRANPFLSDAITTVLSANGY